MTKYDLNKPFFIIPWVIEPDEIFLDITEDAIPGIYPYYMISNYGRIFNKYNKSNPFCSYNVDSKGYWQTSLCTKNGGKLIRNHRIEMLVFNKIQGSDSLVADHIDGNKLNMKLCNLQWLTISENTYKGFYDIRAYGSMIPQTIPDYILRDIELQKQYSQTLKKVKPFYITTYTQKNYNDMKSEYNCQSSPDNIHLPKTNHSKDEKRKICKLLQEGYTSAYIAAKLHVKKSYVSAILHKQTATDLSDNYDFSNYGSIPYNDKWIFTTEQAISICKYLQDYGISNYNSKKNSIKQMFAILGIQYNDQRYRTVLDIYNGRAYKSIAKDYKFK